MAGGPKMTGSVSENSPSDGRNPKSVVPRLPEMKIILFGGLDPDVVCHNTRTSPSGGGLQPGGRGIEGTMNKSSMHVPSGYVTLRPSAYMLCVVPPILTSISSMPREAVPSA